MVGSKWTTLLDALSPLGDRVHDNVIHVLESARARIETLPTGKYFTTMDLSDIVTEHINKKNDLAMGANLSKFGGDMKDVNDDEIALQDLPLYPQGYHHSSIEQALREVQLLRSTDYCMCLMKKDDGDPCHIIGGQKSVLRHMREYHAEDPIYKKACTKFDVKKENDVSLGEVLEVLGTMGIQGSSVGKHPTEDDVLMKANRFYSDFKKSGKTTQFPKVTESTAKALYIYTLETEIYADMNWGLRVKNTECITRFRPLIYHINQGFTQLPNHKLDDSQLYRGLNLNLNEAYKQISFVNWTAFSSTTASHHAVKEFLGGSSDSTAGPKASLFLIKSVKGINIKDFSEFPKEAEVLLPPNTRFKLGDEAGESMKEFIGRQIGVNMSNVFMRELRDATEEDIKAYHQDAKNHEANLWLNAQQTTGDRSQAKIGAQNAVALLPNASVQRPSLLEWYSAQVEIVPKTLFGKLRNDSKVTMGLFLYGRRCKQHSHLMIRTQKGTSQKCSECGNMTKTILSCKESQCQTAMCESCGINAPVQPEMTTGFEEMMKTCKDGSLTVENMDVWSSIPGPFLTPSVVKVLHPTHHRDALLRYGRWKAGANSIASFLPTLGSSPHPKSIQYENQEDVELLRMHMYLEPDTCTRVLLPQDIEVLCKRFIRDTGKAHIDIMRPDVLTKVTTSTRTECILTVLGAMRHPKTLNALTYCDTEPFQGPSSCSVCTGPFRAKQVRFTDSAGKDSLCTHCARSITSINVNNHLINGPLELIPELTPTRIKSLSPSVFTEEFIKGVPSTNDALNVALAQALVMLGVQGVPQATALRRIPQGSLLLVGDELEEPVPSNVTVELMKIVHPTQCARLIACKVRPRCGKGHALLLKDDEAPSQCTKCNDVALRATCSICKVSQCHSCITARTDVEVGSVEALFDAVQGEAVMLTSEAWSVFPLVLRTNPHVVAKIRSDTVSKSVAEALGKPGTEKVINDLLRTTINSSVTFTEGQLVAGVLPEHATNKTLIQKLTRKALGAVFTCLWSQNHKEAAKTFCTLCPLRDGQGGTYPQPRGYTTSVGIRPDVDHL
eukprot:PhF_6_TR38663/c4_g2_i1/m.57818